MDGIDASKADLRRRAAALRRAVHARLGAIAGDVLAAFFPVRLAPCGYCVAGYWPIGEEIDPRPLMTRLEREGCRLALPVVEARAEPLGFRAYRSGQALEAGPHHTFQPAFGAFAMDPDLLLVPLLAFDETGGRLGYGGGYYDRTLGELRQRRSILAVGLAYSAQRVEKVPLAGNDQRLDWIVTETGAFETRR